MLELIQLSALLLCCKNLFVTSEIFYMHTFSWEIYDYDGIEENIKEYHNALVANGVTNYCFSELLDDFVSTVAGYLINLIFMMVTIKPESIINLFKNFAGEEKMKGFMKVLENGLFNKSFLIMTSLYVRDKESFLLVKS